MTFDAVMTKDGRQCFVDGYPVSEAVYDTLFPSKLFPVDTGLSLEVAEAEVGRIKAAMGEAHAKDKGLRVGSPISEVRPLRSDSLAVHTKQIPAVMARNEKHGLRIKYDRAGRPVFTCASQRRALMKIESEVKKVKIVKQNSYDGY